jgi:hypothetical protein
MGLLDARFKYIPAARTDVAATWRRFGFRPTTDAERRFRSAQGDDGAADETRPTGPVPRRRRRADSAVRE